MATIKLYLHHESDPEFTTIVRLEGSCAVADLVAVAIQEVSKRSSHPGQPRLCQLETSNRKRIVNTTATISSAFRDKDDVFINCLPDLSSASSTTCQTTTATPSVRQQHNPKHRQPTATKQTESSTCKQQISNAPSRENPKDTDLTQSACKAADAALNNKQYRRAFAIIKKALEGTPGCTELLLKLAAVHAAAGQHTKAVEVFKQVLQQHGVSVEVLLLHANSLRLAGRYTEAAQHYQQLLDHCRKVGAEAAVVRGVQLGLTAAMRAVGGEFAEAAGALLVQLLREDVDDPLALRQYAEGVVDEIAGHVCLVDDGGDNAPSCVRHGGELAVGAAALHLMESAGSSTHGPTGKRVGWGTAEQTAKLQDAVRILLRLLVACPSDKLLRAALATAVQAPGGFEVLEAVTADLPLESRGQVAAFLATCVKEYSAVRAAVQLYHVALRWAPCNASYCLNLMHVLELHQQYSAALDEFKGFCRNAGTGQDRPWGSLEAQLPAVLDALDGLPLFHSATSLAWYLHWLQQDQGLLTTTTEAHPSPLPKPKYTNPQLDLLATLFTAVKILFCGGQLAAASRVCTLLLPLKEASAQPLHLTLIRNEAAYFGCIHQLLSQYPPPTPLKALPPPLYLVGDSHTLPPAWRHVQLRGERRLLQPLLVTGCKVWHLRPHARFYPKAQLLSSVRQLPDGSQVMMLLGEIDCREGLLVAVEKCKYDSLAEAVAATVDIYMTVLLNLIKMHKFEIFVHPPAPVLNETRPVVRQFTEKLKARCCEAAMDAHSAAAGKLHYLDFFDQLLNGSGDKFDQSLGLDGTHMAPLYLERLQKALDTCS